MNTLIIAKTVGYMLKAMKLKKNTSLFHKEFASIRHGNYYAFTELIKGEIPTVVVYNNGEIHVNKKITKEEIDFVGLIKSGPSLIKFHEKCLSEFGKLVDKDIPDEIYEKVALFEISLRMHANNENLINSQEDLIEVIFKLSKSKNLPNNLIEKLQNGRRFLNMIKHPNNQFPSWNDGINAFNKAYSFCQKYSLTVI
jgi:type III secretion system FlhB-like substrate exporter